MKITSFAKMVCAYEGKKKETSIAQVMEVLKIVNKLLDGKMYKDIRKIMPKKGCIR